MPVKKKTNRKWRVCINFTDLNKACLKDSYPLSKIKQLVDSIIGHELYNFLDAKSGYHQISMAKEDREKFSLITDQSIYYYNMMLFRFKNTRATFLRLINKVFANK